ncbi:MAG: MBL fold metallo-hydrolase [Promethearchaeota archaeon]
MQFKDNYANFLQAISEEPLIYLIQGERKAKYPYSNSLLIDDVLIDTGCSKRILKKIKKEFVVRKILLTHWHEDHISSNSVFLKAKENEKCKFYAHKNDAKIINDISNIPKLYGIIGTPIEEQFNAFLSSFRLKNTPIEQYLTDNYVLKIQNGHEIIVIFTPGHSAGHVCFYIPSVKFIFLGDIDFSSFGPWYGCLDSNLEDFERSLEKLKYLQIEHAACGHFNYVSSSKMFQEKIQFLKNILKERDEAILANFSERNPKTPKDLLDKGIIYKKYNFFKEYLLIAEEIMIKNHLEKFLHQNLIKKIEEGYILS